jgi:hypothetical protein
MGTSQWNDAKELLPEGGKDVLVAIRKKWCLSENWSSIEYAIAYYALKTKKWEIQESPVHEYPANYWEGEYMVVKWMELPPLI